MAGDLKCDMGCGTEAAFIVGNTETGEQLLLCAPDFARFGLEMAKSALPPEEIAAAIGPLFVQGAADGAEAERPKRARKSKAPPEPEPEPRPEAAPEVAPEAAADAHG
jgi:hypothetical protein